MVIGNGLIAKTFNDYINDKDIIIFASGVSNSTEKNSLSFEREYKLLKDTITKFSTVKFIYFSTCSIDDDSVNERPYVKHKLVLENYIILHVKRYLIFRVSNVIGYQGNAHTILNFLVSHVKNGSEIELWKFAERNLIDAEDVKLIVDDVLKKNINNRIVNIALKESSLVVNIVEQIEVFFNLKANVRLVDKGNSLHIDTSKITSSLDKIESLKGTGLQYINNLLLKYYSH